MLYKYDQTFFCAEMPTQMACIFCGTTRWKFKGQIHSLAEIHSIFTKHIIQTDFHYALVMNLQPSVVPHVRSCWNCSNWKRHIVKKNTAKRYSPVDHLIHYATEPGPVLEPDHRCLPRLISVILDPANPFHSLLSVHCVAILSSALDKTDEEIPQAVGWAWWKINESSPFFRSKKTSKIVRRVKRQRERYDFVKPRQRWRH